MKNFAGLILLATVFLTLLSGCKRVATPNGIQDQARTHYDSLNLDTPEASVRAFLEAFYRADFVTVYMILAPETQYELFRQAEQLKLDTSLFASHSQTDINTLQQEFIAEFSLADLEHNWHIIYHFDSLLLTAAETGMLPILQQEPESVFESRRRIRADGANLVAVRAEFGSDDGPLDFWLIESPEGKWRVLQAVWSGGDSRVFPLAFPPTPLPCSSQEQVINYRNRTPYDRLDLSTPVAAVATFAEAFQHRDYPAVYWILHPDAQREWLLSVALNRYSEVVEANAPDLLQEMAWVQRLHQLEREETINHSESIFAYWIGLRSGFYYRHTPVLPLIMEQLGDPSYLFDQVMLASEGQHLVDMSGSLETLEVQEIVDEDGNSTTRVIANSRDSDENLTIILKQALSGNWRVVQVSNTIEVGGSLPWSVPADSGGEQ